MSERVPLSEPYLAGNAQAYLDECVRTNFVSSVGPFVDRFEREFAAFVGVRHAVACSTSAQTTRCGWRR
jgi:dTDP-4-amino-4,6-dideoxygalactose transaminase